MLMVNNNYKGKKAVFFDIDGTLYDRLDERQVPQSTKDAIRLLQENGHLALICTGRCDCMVEDYLRTLNFDGYIFGCGTNIVFEGEELFYQTMPQEQIERMIKFCEKYEAIPILEGKHRLYIPNEGSLDHGETYRFYKSFFVKDVFPLTDEPVEISKMMARFVERTPEKIEAFNKEVSDEMDVFDHGKGFEMVPKGFSKASGIKHLIEMLGIKKEDTYAFGDSQNDLSMLTYVGTGIAMGNGMEDVLKACKIRTDKLYDDGIYNACKKIGLID
jgi:hypothetical protein